MAQEWKLVAYISSADDVPSKSRPIADFRRWRGHVESYEDPSYNKDGKTGLDGDYWASVEDAIAWARARTEIILVRIGNTHYSAGPLHAEDEDDEPLPLWPPA